MSREHETACTLRNISKVYWGFRIKDGKFSQVPPKASQDLFWSFDQPCHCSGMFHKNLNLGSSLGGHDEAGQRSWTYRPRGIMLCDNRGLFVGCVWRVIVKFTTSMSKIVGRISI
jgi:hypothetical protein